MQGPFLFVTCQVGAEKLLKEELASRAPELKPAYGRPGIVTFKRDAPFADDYRLPSAFGRAVGVSYTRLPVAGLTRQTLLAALPEEASEATVIHCFARDHAVPGDDDKGPNPLAPVVSTLRASLGSARDVAQGRELVLDVVVVEEDACLVGFHRHGRGASPYPGGKPPFEMAQDAPSRAYLKLREALLVFDLEPEKGQTAVEIGSAPGGAAFALLEAGLNVTGIDPADVDPRLFDRSTEAASYTHIRKPFAQVGRAELPAQVDWLLADINVSPDVTIAAAEKFVQMLSPKPKGLVLTLKLTETKFASEIPAFLNRIRKLGYPRVAAKQLAFGRREVVLAAS